MSACGCTWDPGFHRDLNARRGKADQGERCTNVVPADAYAQQGGVCLPCVHGCPPDDDGPSDVAPAPPRIWCADARAEVEHPPHWHVVRAGGITFAQGQCQGHKP